MLGNHSDTSAQCFTAVLVLRELALSTPVRASISECDVQQVRCRAKQPDLVEHMWNSLYSTHEELRGEVVLLLESWLVHTQMEPVFCNVLTERLFNPEEADTRKAAVISVLLSC
mgnify:CR=1 FL=1